MTFRTHLGIMVACLVLQTMMSSASFAQSTCCPVVTLCPPTSGCADMYWSNYQSSVITCPQQSYSTGFTYSSAQPTMMSVREAGSSAESTAMFSNSNSLGPGAMSVGVPVPVGSNKVQILANTGLIFELDMSRSFDVCMRNCLLQTGGNQTFCQQCCGNHPEPMCLFAPPE